MPCFCFALSLMSSAFLGGTLSWEMPRLPSMAAWEQMMTPSKSFLNALERDWLPESLPLVTSWRESNSPAPLEIGEFEDSLRNQDDMTGEPKGALPLLELQGEKSSNSAPSADPAAWTLDEEYSYVYEIESPAETQDGAEAKAIAGVDDNSDWKDYPASAEKNSPGVGLSSLLDGTLGVLEQSTADLSVVFRNISVQISRWRGSF
jgi:hypothetical protein